MPTIPNCYFVEFEKLGIIGLGEAPAALGPHAYPLAVTNAQVNAALKVPAHAAEKAEQLRQEYMCDDPLCPDVFVEMEATPEFGWRQRFLGRRDDQIMAIYILEIEFLIFCVDMPEDQGEDETEPIQDDHGWEEVSKQKEAAEYGMFERGKDGEIVWKPSRLPPAFRQKQSCG